MKQTSIKLALRRKHPEIMTLVTCCDKKGKPNIITLAWFMQTSFDPPMLAISVGHSRYSHKLLQQTKEFVLSLPNEKMIDAVLYCGTHSGKNINKFKETGLKILKAVKVKPPLIKGASACFECKIKKEISAGDHTIFLGEILAAHISQKYQQSIFNLGQLKFATFKK